MSWIVQSKDAAEKAGADMKNDEAMYAITPASVGEVFNSHMADQDPDGDWSCSQSAGLLGKTHGRGPGRNTLRPSGDYIEKQDAEHG